MGFVEIFIIAIGLSMDAFAVSVAKGLAMKRIQWSQALIIALFFGVFQAAMPCLGYFLGSTFAEYVSPIDHWITFAFLSLIGAKMIYDGIQGDSDEDDESGSFSIKELFMLAIATSIDAFAVGCTFAFVEVAIWSAVATIGITTFVLSLIGVMLGHKVGTRYNQAATIAGGVVLILIGAKTLLEHLGFISF